MAHAEFLAQVGVVGERKHASGRLDPSAADDRSAVVQRRFGIENVFQKLRRRFRVEDRAGADLVVETVIALKDDERTGARCGHIHAGKHRLRNGGVGIQCVRRAQKPGENRPCAELFQKPADLRLEQYDQREKAHLHGVAENVVHGVELHLAGQPERKEYIYDTLKQLVRLRAADQRDQEIEERCDKKDIDDIHHADRAEMTERLSQR